MDDEPDKAHVGQGSRSTGITFTPQVEMAFERALAEAKARSSGSLTSERVLAELLDEDTVTDLMAAAGVDVDALRADLMARLSAETSTAPAGGEPGAEEALQSAMRRAVIKALASNARGASGADIVVAILVEGETYAAELLQTYGLSAEPADNVRLEHYLRRNREQARRLAELQARARAHRQQSAGLVAKGADAHQRISKTGVGRGPRRDAAGHHAYTLRISSDDSERERVPFKAALSRNGVLDLYIEETPFEIEFVASTVVGLFEAVEGGDRLRVQLVADVEGQERVVSGFGGSAGAIFEDRDSPVAPRSGALD